MGPLLGSGRTADVFALDGRRVLRRYRDGSDTGGELAVMTHLAEHGYPVPAAWTGAAPGELVLERLAGPTLRDALVAGDITPEAAGELLAGLLHRLHAVPAAVGADPAHRILHLDLHPENVLLTPRGPVVIDWATADEGPPGLDAGMSVLILAEAVFSLPEGLAEAARAVLASLVRHLGGPGDLAAARARRAANPTLGAAEVRRLDAAVALGSRSSSG
ncbi:aminoglycoside phosphotransferase family protein [Streptomyces kaniharaensis]|uniref:Aminoglycoside phosphotransferase family protein n=1 Tax=Streptomyces kaniharaensis TaxID=212423 RepID=A0A6N7KSD1_9ACTN|nr:aminoglycoside phosphotransferase family protein [Streptomyces kaniharaensis]